MNAGVNMNWTKSELELPISRSQLTGGTITINGQGKLSAGGVVTLQAGGNVVLDADPVVTAAPAVKVPQYTTVAETLQDLTG